MMEYVGSAVKDMGVSASNGPGGSVANCRAVANGEYELGWAFTSTVYDAYGATGAFSEDEPMENLTHIMSIFPSQQHFVVPADSSIQSLADINGKVVNFHTFAVEQQLFDAGGHILEDPVDRALRIRRVVLGHVFGQSARVERLVCHRPRQPLTAERGGLGLVLILFVTNHVCLILKLIIRMKNRYRSGEAALPFFPFRYNKDNTLISCRHA